MLSSFFMTVGLGDLLLGVVIGWFIRTFVEAIKRKTYFFFNRKK